MERVTRRKHGKQGRGRMAARRLQTASLAAP
jgi:hypothetical protein